MISIDNIVGTYILDLNKVPKNSHEFIVNSRGDKGNIIPWGLELVIDKSVNASKIGDKLTIETDYKKLKSETAIILKNYNKERLFIKIIPNKTTLEDKLYKFEMIDKVIDNGILSFKLISVVNDREAPWKCVYLGNPMSYDISKIEGYGSCDIIIKLLTELISDFPSKIIFEQEDSENIIELSLINGKEGIKKAD